MSKIERRIDKARPRGQNKKAGKTRQNLSEAMKMKNTTLCYIERDGRYLMLHRVKKHDDANAGKWIGIGGKFEADESPDDCLLREVREETGLTLTRYRPRGIVTFVSDRWETEIMHLYTADAFTGEEHACDEGDLAWVPIPRVEELPLLSLIHI